MMLGENRKKKIVFLRRLLFAICILILPWITQIIIKVFDFYFGDGDGNITGFNLPVVFFFLRAISIVLLLYITVTYYISRRFIANITLSIISILSVFFIGELACGLLEFNTQRKEPLYFWEGSYFDNFIVADSVLGSKPGSDRTGQLTKINNKAEIIYQATYTTDSLGRRIFPSKPNHQYALFFGCSYTFGEGVNDNETLPYFFNKFDTLASVYNYGFSRYGPHQMLALLEHKNLKKEVCCDSGFAVYTFISNHVNRTICDFQVSSWQKDGPCYEISGDDVLYKGSFGKAFPKKLWVFNALNKSNIVTYTNLNWPLFLREKDYVLTAKVIKKAFLNYKKQFGNNNFYVLIYPGSSEEIIKYIDEEINVINYSKLFNPENALYHIVNDGHPTAKAYEKVAKKLAEDIQTNFNR